MEHQLIKMGGTVGIFLKREKSASWRRSPNLSLMHKLSVSAEAAVKGVLEVAVFWRFSSLLCCRLQWVFVGCSKALSFNGSTVGVADRGRDVDCSGSVDYSRDLDYSSHCRL